ncbi:MAG: hypothetical protein MJ179_02485 [Treponema sp.]|nr:hypothetical protein [Treponema sp.]
MNGRTSKKIRQVVTRNAKESFNDVVETIESLPFRKRVALCWKLLMKKL